MNHDQSDAPQCVSGSCRSSWLILWAAAVVSGILVAVSLNSWLSSDRQQPSPVQEPVTDLAQEANDYLREKKAEPLSGPLQNLLADPAKKWVATKPHPLLNLPAPPFALTGADGKRVDLEDLLTRGPVVLVFYYGYTCDHCVAQLFAINKDLQYFTELKATVLGVSPDTPEHTREMYAEYGGFNFPVLSDGDHSVAIRYGVYRPAAENLSRWQTHATFVIDRDHHVRWVNTGVLPFTDNATLLHELAQLGNVLPPTK